MESTGEAYGYAKAYVEQQIEYAKLDVAERISTAISSAITTIVVLQLVFFSVAFVDRSWHLCWANVWILM